MNAGLLGEHLASPRTATKTNQSTALDPKPAQSGDSSNKDEFASLVTKDTANAQPDAPAEDTAIAAAATQDTVTSQTQIQSLGLEVDPATTDDAIATDADLDAIKTNVAVTSDPAAAETPQTLDAALRSADSEAVLDPTQAGDAGEIAAQDPRARSQADLRDTARDPRDQTIKLSARNDTIDGDPAGRAIDADQAAPLADVADTVRAETSGRDAETPRSLLTTNAADAAEASFRQTVSTDVTAIDRLTTGAARDVTTVIPDAVTTLSAPPTATATTAPTAGLTPTTPSIPLATPNELTSVILNAINNGIDPQEQLVVQMDPPELGRVLIDFKFDAQGLQQIVVTTENPEALKRLRELHFELTQALRDHGLSEQNMSFRQQAGEQSQQGWGGADGAGQDTSFFAAEDRRTSPSIIPNAPSASPRDRLDLLL